MARSVVLVLVVLCFGLGLVGALSARADDVPADVRKAYDDAQSRFARGDLKKAYSAISKGKAKKPLSVDFWDLYVRIWRALGKKEETLWGKIIAKVEAKNPTSPVFDLLRYRLATETEERIGHLKAALEKAPKAVEPRLLLARAYVADGEDAEAEEILDAILADDPGNETALVTKGDLLIESGCSRSAVDHAMEALEEYDFPGLHDLAARGLFQLSETDESALEKAEAEARKAVAARPEPRHVLTLVTILEHVGKDEEALALLSEQYEKSPDLGLARRLGEFVFRTGDYAKAAKTLAVVAPHDRNAALALALCEARRGRAKEARAATDLLLRHDPGAWAWATDVELLLGDAAAARKRIAAGGEEDVSYAEAVCRAWEGNTAETLKRAAEKARDGSRVGEEWLILIAEALLLEKLGGKADAARQLLIAAGWAAGKACVAGAEAPDFEPSVAAQTVGFMHRHASYRRSLGGDFFQSRGVVPVPAVVDGKTTLALGVVSTSDCKRDEQRVFRFNEFEVKEGDTIDLSTFIPGEDEDWEAATKAFAEGSAALVDGDWAKADEAFGKALEKEASWARARLFQAVAKALGGSDLEAAATLAREAVGVLVDDWMGQEVAVLVLRLAGQDGKAEAKALAERQESYATRWYDDFWEDEDEEE